MTCHINIMVVKEGQPCDQIGERVPYLRRFEEELDEAGIPEVDCCSLMFEDERDTPELESVIEKLTSRISVIDDSFKSGGFVGLDGVQRLAEAMALRPYLVTWKTLYRDIVTLREYGLVAGLYGDSEMGGLYADNEPDEDELICRELDRRGDSGS